MSGPDPGSTPGADRMRAVFDAVAPLTVGLEEELMLLDPETADLAPVAESLLGRVGGDPRFKRELPAAQFEIVTPPVANVGEAASRLAESRRALAGLAAGLALPAAAGTHPFAAEQGELNRGPRYDHTAGEYGSYARRQLVFALQVQVAVGGAERALAVYNALRSYLPLLAALAANAPFHAGHDTGLASVRPKLAESLPRQGVPPPLASWEEYADTLRWGAAAGSVPEPRNWWWELRPHPGFGTLELRVPDAQTTVGEAEAVAAVCHCLVAYLAERHDAGEPLEVAPSWRIAENRWWAARDGVEARLADLRSGERRPARELLAELLDALAPAARRLRCEPHLARARELVAENGAIRQRAIAAERGLRGLGGLAGWLAERYLDEGA